MRGSGRREPAAAREDGGAGGRARRRRRFRGWLLASLALAAASGCDIVSSEGRFPENTAFVLDLYATPEDCAAARDLMPESSCYDMIRFCADGTADWLVGGGDIIYRGRYAMKGREVRVRSDQTSLTLRFWLSTNRQTLVRDPTGDVWLRVSGEEIGFSRTGCPSGGVARASAGSIAPLFRLASGG